MTGSKEEIAPHRVAKAPVMDFVIPPSSVLAYPLLDAAQYFVWVAVVVLTTLAAPPELR